MKFDLDFHSGIPIYIQLKEQIKYGIALGHLEPGAQLPTVRKLAGHHFNSNCRTMGEGCNTPLW